MDDLKLQGAKHARGPEPRTRSGPPPWVLVATLALVIIGTSVFLLVNRGQESELSAMTEGAGSLPEQSAVGETARDCAPLPSRCGFPDATNTGIEPGRSLIKVPEELTAGPGWEYVNGGSLVVTEDNAVIENLDISTSVDVQADGVTLRNIRVRLSGETWGIGLMHVSNTQIENVVIGPKQGEPRLIVAIKDIYGDSTNTRIDKADISNVATAVQISSGVVENSYIHDMGFVEGDHTNGIMSNGSTVDLLIRHNTVLIQLGQTDAVGLFQDFGPEANRIIEDNLLAGAGYTVYGGETEGQVASSNIKVRNNRFARTFYANSGAFGYVTAFNAAGAGNEWSGNVWDDTNEPIPLP